MLWIKAFHIIFVVTWFAALFYLPRLFVYHALAEDAVSQTRFKIMERKLYYGIALPGSILATSTGLWLLAGNFTGYLSTGWMQLKLALVAVLWLFQFACNHYRKAFFADRNRRSQVFYRWFNEIPTIILIAVVILVVVKP